MPQSKNYTDPLPLKIYKMKCKSTLARGIHSYLTPSPDYKGVFAKKINKNEYYRKSRMEICSKEI